MAGRVIRKVRKKPRAAGVTQTENESQKAQGQTRTKPEVEQVRIEQKTEREKATKRQARAFAAKGQIHVINEVRQQGKTTPPTNRLQVPRWQREKLVKEAVADIVTGISCPDAQKNGQPFIPENWSMKYRNVLGKYKSFLAEQKDTFSIVWGENGSFIVNKASDTSASSFKRVKPREHWVLILKKAWDAYCSVTPKHRQSTENFANALPKCMMPAAIRERLFPPARKRPPSVPSALEQATDSARAELKRSAPATKCEESEPTFEARKKKARKMRRKP
eukprot:TRINITY_DN32342_c0_g1_i1.p2 TRINITY_DN32342_c0_g1~~TRINITY_DN32342_c0_g1_i1.p2  ORF type:complete len:277 (-),score=49.59 TRINITY_DN32342_c0_g1_i1:104-934(-)